MANAGRRSMLDELDRLDQAAYEAVDGTPTPSLDRGLVVLTNAADYSRLWLGIAAVIAAGGGPARPTGGGVRPRRPGTTSAVANLASSRWCGGPRPERVPSLATLGPHARIDLLPVGSHRLGLRLRPGGGRRDSPAGVPLVPVATVVGYSRVHSGVHFPGDVLAGAVLGSVIGLVSPRAVRWGLARFVRTRWMPDSCG